MQNMKAYAIDQNTHPIAASRLILTRLPFTDVFTLRNQVEFGPLESDPYHRILHTDCRQHVHLLRDRKDISQKLECPP